MKFWQKFKSFMKGDDLRNGYVDDQRQANWTGDRSAFVTFVSITPIVATTEALAIITYRDLTMSIRDGSNARFIAMGALLMICIGWLLCWLRLIKPRITTTRASRTDTIMYRVAFCFILFYFFRSLRMSPEHEMVLRLVAMSVYEALLIMIAFIGSFVNYLFFSALQPYDLGVKWVEWCRMPNERAKK